MYMYQIRAITAGGAVVRVQVPARTLGPFSTSTASHTVELVS